MSNRSATATAPMAQPMTAQPTTATMPAIPRDRIAMRAYDRWIKGGCKHGCDQQDWIEAEKELRQEITRPAAPKR